MSTDHRAEAERWIKKLPQAQHVDFPLRAGDRASTASAHLLAAIHDEQREQTELLHHIRDLLAVMAEPTGDIEVCGCWQCEPTPLVSRDLTEMQDRINATLSDPNIDAALNTVRHVGVTGVHEAGGCEDCSEPEPHGHVWKRQQNVTSRGYAMDPIEVCECGAARRATDPEPETVTVSLPRDVVTLVWARLDDALSDALDAEVGK